MEKITRSETETERLGEELAQRLTAGAVIAMYGDLGAGKTAFVRGLARGLGIRQPVSSPTFTIVNEYLGGRLPLFHFDMYRLSDEDELYNIGWDDYLERGGVCVAEWSENVEGAFDGGAWRVKILRLSDTERKITVEIPGGERD